MQGTPVYAVGLDAGSNYTRFAIGVLEHSKLRVIGIGQAESQGWVKGRIADQRAASDAILRAVREAEATAQVTVESAVAGRGGPTVRGPNHPAAIEVGATPEKEPNAVSRVND